MVRSSSVNSAKWKLTLAIDLGLSPACSLQAFANDPNVNEAYTYTDAASDAATNVIGFGSTAAAAAGVHTVMQLVSRIPFRGEGWAESHETQTQNVRRLLEEFRYNQTAGQGRELILITTDGRSYTFHTLQDEARLVQQILSENLATDQIKSIAVARPSTHDFRRVMGYSAVLSTTLAAINSGSYGIARYQIADVENAPVICIHRPTIPAVRCEPTSGLTRIFSGARWAGTTADSAPAASSTGFSGH